MQFEVYRKRGRAWQYLGEYGGSDGIGAARKASYVHNIRVLGTRPAGANVNLNIVRLKHIAHLSYA